MGEEEAVTPLVVSVQPTVVTSDRTEFHLSDGADEGETRDPA